MITVTSYFVLILEGRIDAEADLSALDPSIGTSVERLQKLDWTCLVLSGRFLKSLLLCCRFTACDTLHTRYSSKQCVDRGGHSLLSFEWKHHLETNWIKPKSRGGHT